MFGRQAVTQQTAQIGTLPAPTGGIDAASPLMQMPPDRCIYTYNLVASEGGCEVRKGTVEWATGLGGAVRTLIPFGGGLPTAAVPRLFAVTEQGIYDVTASDTQSPALLYQFTTDSSGVGSFVNYTNDNGDHRILYADTLGGFYEYDPDTISWTPVTGLTGAITDHLEINYVIHHKERLWVGKLNSPDGYYMEPGAYTGSVTRFTLGSKYKHGGVLSSMVSWSRDGGDGLDDMLVIVSTAGDVLIYNGYDPAVAEYWQLVGQWYIGDVPPEKRTMLEHSGDIFMLSRLGIVSLNALMRSGQGVGDEATDRFSKIAREKMKAQLDDIGWAFWNNPSTDSIIVQTPPGITKPAETLGTTFDPTFNTDKVGYSQDNQTIIQESAATRGQGMSTTTHSDGLRYFEIEFPAIQGGVGTFCAVGIGPAGRAPDLDIGEEPDEVGYFSNGGMYNEGNFTGSWGATWASGTTIGLVVNLETGYVEWFRDGVSEGSITASFTQGVEYHAVAQVWDQFDTATARWETADMKYPIPGAAIPWGEVARPERNEPSIQYIFDRTTKAWSFWRDVEASCFESWQGEQYFGTYEGQVFIMRGAVDNVLITPVTQNVFGDSKKIVWSLLTAYSQLGGDARFKIPSEIRPMFLASSLPAYDCKPLFDFDLSEILTTNNANQALGSLWGTALWDEAVWIGGIGGQDNLSGAAGIGRHIAIALRGESSVDTTLLGFDLAWRAGGWR